MAKNCPKCGSECKDFGPTPESEHLWLCHICEVWVDDVINIDEIKFFISKALELDWGVADRNWLTAIQEALCLKPDNLRKLGSTFGWSFYEKEGE